MLNSWECSGSHLPHLVESQFFRALRLVRMCREIKDCSFIDLRTFVFLGGVGLKARAVIPLPIRAVKTAETLDLLHL
ncbi:hypothetical protein Tco_0204843 [Tanacetum coccineum]